MIENMETELTEASKVNSKTENSAVTEVNILMNPSLQKPMPYLDWNVSKKELNTQAYLKTMNIDIENINTFEKRNKVYTNKWRTIYEVIEPEFFL